MKNEEGPVREDEALIVRSEADGTRTRNHRRDKPELYPIELPPLRGRQPLESGCRRGNDSEFRQGCKTVNAQ